MITETMLTIGKLNSVQPLFLLALIGVARGAPITEQEAVEHALRTNSDIRVLRIEHRADSLSGEADRAGRLPSLQITARGHLSSDSLSPSARLSPSRATDAGLALTQPLPGGAVLSGSVETAGRNDPRIGMSRGATRAGIEITQPLLRGSGRNAPVDYRLIISAIERNQANENTRGELHARIAEIRGLYWSCYESRALRDVAAADEANARNRLDQERSRHEIGLAPPLDTMSAHLELLQAIARHDKARTDAEIRTRELAQALGMPPDSVVPDSSLSVDFADLPDTHRFTQTVLSVDPQLRNFELVRQKLHAQIDNARNRELPQLELSASYGSELGHGSAAEGLSRSGAVALNFSYTLPTKAQRLERRRLELSAQAHELNRMRAIEKVTNEVEELYAAWNQGKRALDIARRSVELAGAMRESAREGYMVGTVDRHSLIKANNDYVVAAISTVREQVGLKRIEILLDQLSGFAFSTLGVEVA